MHRRAALLGLDLKKLALTNPTGDGGAKLITVDWESMYTLNRNLCKLNEDAVDPIEEVIKQARMAVPAVAERTVSSAE
jgi:hypothetical protein